MAGGGHLHANLTIGQRDLNAGMVRTLDVDPRDANAFVMAAGDGPWRKGGASSSRATGASRSGDAVGALPCKRAAPHDGACPGAESRTPRRAGGGERVQRALPLPRQWRDVEERGADEPLVQRRALRRHGVFTVAVAPVNDDVYVPTGGGDARPDRQPKRSSRQPKRSSRQPKQSGRQPKQSGRQPNGRRACYFGRGTSVPKGGFKLPQ